MKHKNGRSKTYALIVNDYDLFNASVPAELIVQVPLGAANAETKNAQNTGGVWSLI